MAAIPRLMRRGVTETLSVNGPYTANTTEPVQWAVPVDAAGDQCFAWQTVLGGSGSFTSITVTLNVALDGVHFSQYDVSTAIAGEARFPAGKPVTLQIVVSNLVVNAGSPTMAVLGLAR